MIKQVLFSYEEEWFHRKKSTGKTWRQIMEIGIKAAEDQILKSLEKTEEETKHFKGTPPPNVIEKTRKIIPLSAKETSHDTVIVSEKKISEINKIPNGSFEIIISKPDSVKERFFDVYEEDVWATVNTFSDIIEGEIFRVRDDDVVVNFHGSKCISYEGNPYKNERGQKCVMVVARKI